MLVADLVYIDWAPHSAQSCTFAPPWHNHPPTTISFCLSGTYGTFTAVQSASECHPTCTSIQSTFLTVQPTSEHFTPCNIVQSVHTSHTHVQSVSNHHTTVFEHQHQQHIKYCQLNRPVNSQYLWCYDTITLFLPRCWGKLSTSELWLNTDVLPCIFLYLCQCCVGEIRRILNFYFVAFSVCTKHYWKSQYSG
jgi:hypothetical protein